MRSENDMNRQYIEDNHIIDRYLLGQLADEEAFAFEAYYFEHPEMLEELKIAKSMQETLRQQSGSLQASNETKFNLNWVQWLVRPQLGFAISAILAVAVLGLMIENKQLKLADNIAYQAPSLTLSQTRSSNTEILKIHVAKNQPAIVVHFELGPIGYSEVRLQLSDASGDALWQKVVKVDGSLGAVDLVLAVNQLKSGIYQLSAFPPSGGDKALTLYNFELNID